MTTISVTLLDEDPEVLERQVRLLRDDLRGLDVDVDFEPAPPVPANAKGDPKLSHTIVVTDATSSVLADLGRVLGDFADHGRRKVVVKDGERRLTIEGPVDDTARQAIAAFFAD
ncbi:hypothetical protein LFM09_28670 [Lentzea alba]|uniref:hypothetical protein n=1 Tax=Lentzea alba TaxID=2714351 RepID=UPI0039BEF789